MELSWALNFGFKEDWSPWPDKRVVSFSSNLVWDLISTIKIQTEKISKISKIIYYLAIIMICILPRTTKIRDIRVDKNRLRQSHLVFSCGPLASSTSEVLLFFNREKSSFWFNKSSDCLSWVENFILMTGIHFKTNIICLSWLYHNICYIEKMVFLSG